MKLFLKLKYDGTRYAGYQVQNNAPTVQAALNSALKDMFGRECDVTGCSRTDSGVHADCFCATVQFKGLQYLETDIPCDKIPFALNFRLPDDISVFFAEMVDEEFHARYSVVSKTYEYRILNAPHRDPFLKNRAYHFPKNISDKGLSDMKRAAELLCGRHDFAAFMSSGSSVQDTVRNIFYCNIRRDGDQLIIRINADGFLYNMVRIICGTLLEVGKGAIAPEHVADIIDSKNRSLAGPTLPACGLYLSEVNYK